MASKKMQTNKAYFSFPTAIDYKLSNRLEMGLSNSIFSYKRSG